MLILNINALKANFKVISVSCFVMLFCLQCYGQDQKFIIKEVIDSNKVLAFLKNNFTVDRNNIFEDSTYIVSKTCSGEWGGSIKFKNKRTGVVYTARATCPVVVNKLNGKYYVTNTLAHLYGFSTVLEIRKPSLMAIFKLPKRRNKKGEITFGLIGDDESNSTKGTVKIVDSIGILTLATFPFKDELYHVITDYEKTYLAKVVNKKFVTIDTISERSISSVNPEIYTTKDNHFIVCLNDLDVKGYLDIFENKILLVRSK